MVVVGRRPRAESERDWAQWDHQGRYRLAGSRLFVDALSVVIAVVANVVQVNVVVIV